MLLPTTNSIQKFLFPFVKICSSLLFLFLISDVIMGPLEIKASKNRLRPGDNLEIRCSLPTIRGQISNRNFSWTKMNGDISSNVQPQGTVIQNDKIPFKKSAIFKCQKQSPCN